MRNFKLFFLLIISFESLAQDTSWKKKVFNEVLTFSIPAKFDHSESSYLKGIGGYVNSNFYGFQYYDTIILPVKNEKEFRVVLLGFISGRTQDPSLKKYDVTVVDTALNGIEGLMAHYTTADKSESYKKISYYVTMANNQFYWFYVYSPQLKVSDEGTDFYFRSIKFDKEKLMEKSFKLAPIHLTKKAD